MALLDFLYYLGLMAIFHGPFDPLNEYVKTLQMTSDPDTYLTPPQIIRRYGYPVEMYIVSTQDGFLLELDRIPYGKSGKGDGDRYPILLIHGFEYAAFEWIANRPGRALDTSIKMVYNGPIIDKCDVNNINGYDVTYMNKLNETLQVNEDLKFNPSKEDTAKLNGTASDNEPATDTQNAIWTQEQLAENKNPCNRTTSDDSGLESAASSWDKSVTEVKEHAFTKLEEELQHAREILRLRDEEVMKLSRIRQDVETELQELTASLFQEAHRMVREANIKQAAAEKALKESTMKVDVLTAEVAALKTLVLTSTPSKPNLHLHGQVPSKIKEDNSLASNCGSSFFKKNHQRSPSHFDLKYGRDSSPSQLSLEEIHHTLQSDPLEVKDGYEMDPNVHREFLMWKESPTLEKDNAFITRIYREDIDQSLDFNNSSLATEVKKAIDLENIFIEAVDKSKCHFPKKCALMEMPRLCYYRMKISDSEEWHCISQICRNRIISVCNFLNYLRYIQRGLVKSSAEDMYWEIVRYRKEMTFARLGLPASPSSS